MNPLAQGFTLSAMSLLVVALFAAAWANPPKAIRLAKAEALVAVGVALPEARARVREEPPPPPGRRGDEARTKTITYAVLVETFGELGYELASITEGAAGVPRLFLAALPTDLAQVPENAERKTIFIRAVLPLVLQVNEEIRAERSKLADIRARLRASRHVSAADRRWLGVMAERYETTPGDVEQLMKRVDIIPVSLALAQAAEESGWGSSRFVREGNALFGQWTTAIDGHLLPMSREEGKTHRVAAFDSLLDSARAYARNLNSHGAYRDFRDARARFRVEAREPDGFDLAGTMARYSQRGADYVRRLRGLIVANGLRELDDATLDGREVRLGDKHPVAGLLKARGGLPRT
ncbi:MAG: hypothetical protein FJX42_03965 [Alphaproteobacteria bacterium]|nr:hypothetical protein [Alphaproteobacteria bacterium]